MGGITKGGVYKLEPSQAARGFRPKTMIYKIDLLCFVRPSKVDPVLAVGVSSLKPNNPRKPKTQIPN